MSRVMQKIQNKLQVKLIALGLISKFGIFIWFFYLLLGLVAADYDASVATLESIALSLGNELKTQISFISGFSF